MAVSSVTYFMDGPFRLFSVGRCGHKGFSCAHALTSTTTTTTTIVVCFQYTII